MGFLNDRQLRHLIALGRAAASDDDAGAEATGEQPSSNTQVGFSPDIAVLDRFRIGSQLARGGMGAVYRAEDGSTGRDVAVKIPHAGSAGAEARFLREAETLANVAHPGIVDYIAHGQTTEGTPFLATEMVEGETLAERLRRGRVPVDEGLHIVRIVAGALGAVHAAGLVHRDVKPANILICRSGDVKLLDFGLTRRVDGNSKPVTQTGHTVGTIGYMAPEQARGVADVDARADVFALGCVMFEVLTGSKAFPARDVRAFVAALVEVRVPQIARAVPDAPAWVQPLLDSMLATDRERRPRDGAAVHAAMSAAPLSMADGGAHRDPYGWRRTLLGRGRPFVGRSTSLRALHRSLTQESPYGFAVTGAAGVGKSRLVVELLDQLRDLKPLCVHWLRPAPRCMLSRHGRAGHLSVACRVAEARLTEPELSRVLVGKRAPPMTNVWVVEDAEQADDASLGLLGQMLRAHQGFSVVIGITSHAPGAARFAQSIGVPLHEVGPIDATALEPLYTDVARDVQLPAMETVSGRVAGSAFLFEAMVRVAGHRGLDALGDAADPIELCHRLVEDLDPYVRWVLRCASLLDPWIDVTALDELMGQRDVAGISAALSALTRREVLVRSPGHHRFRHPLMALAADKLLAPRERERGMALARAWFSERW